MCYNTLYLRKRDEDMDTVLVDRKKFMDACYELVGEVHWKDMAFLLYEHGFSIAEVHSLQFAYVFPLPTSDEEWKMYKPIPVIFPAVYMFQREFGKDISIAE